jgi:hypothetical protein
MVTIFGGGRWTAAGSLGGGAVVPGGVIAWSVMQSPGPGGSTITVSKTTSPLFSTGTTTGGPGIDPTTFYAVAGIAVIAIFAAGALAVKRRKPTP